MCVLLRSTICGYTLRSEVNLLCLFSVFPFLHIQRDSQKPSKSTQNWDPEILQCHKKLTVKLMLLLVKLQCPVSLRSSSLWLSSRRSIRGGERFERVLRGFWGSDSGPSLLTLKGPSLFLAKCQNDDLSSFEQFQTTHGLKWYPWDVKKRVFWRSLGGGPGVFTGTSHFDSFLELWDFEVILRVKSEWFRVILRVSRVPESES